MFRSIEDFSNEWTYEYEATLKLFGNLTNESLSQEIKPGGRDIGFLAWHMVETVSEMLKTAGLTDIDELHDLDKSVRNVHKIKSDYERLSKQALAAVKDQWTDEKLLEKVPMYGEEWAKGFVLQCLILHQAHHRGQMEVLMRQAGLKVTGIYGPAEEEWAAMGMEPQK
ncbi:MAG: DinB family protein [Ignavibacteria bacterium]|jgi:uncharacterized damage-inducible protein DinB|nr:DinB family protein [Ignavibacteria bacterium]